MLKINDLSFHYGKGSSKYTVLSDYTLEIAPGSICGLLGRNGAGKTTLLYLIAGLLHPDNGSISFNGYAPDKRDVNFLNDIYIVPEEYSLPSVTLMEYVKAITPFYPKFDIEALRSHLETFELPMTVHLGSLSMGQKKRVIISFALACNTSLLLLDEPTNGLDIPGKRMFRKAVVNAMTDEKTIIVSTHQVRDVENILDHLVIIDKKGVILNSSTRDVSRSLHFSFTPNRMRAEQALMSLDVPGGYNIVEIQRPDMEESEINLETLFELATYSPEVLKDIIRQLPPIPGYENDNFTNF